MSSLTSTHPYGVTAGMVGSVEWISTGEKTGGSPTKIQHGRNPPKEEEPTIR